MHISSQIKNTVQPMIEQAQTGINKTGEFISGQIVEKLNPSSRYSQITKLKVIQVIALAIIPLSIVIGNRLATKLEEHKTTEGYIKGFLAFGATVLTGNLILKYALSFPMSRMAIAAITASCLAIRTFILLKHANQELIQKTFDLNKAYEALKRQ